MKTQLFVRFLQEKATQFETIYILGDLFDVWPGTDSHLIQVYDTVLKAIRGVVRRGHRVVYVEGNHDFHLGQYFSDDLGVEVYADSLVENLGDRRVYMAHGDLGNPKDLGYRALRYVLRHRVVHRVKSWVPEEWVFELGARSSKASRKYNRLDPAKENAIRTTYRSTAEKLVEAGHDLVIMGHTHLPDDYRFQVSGREGRYINLGDWVRNFTYLEFDGTDFYTKTHPIKNL